MTERCPWSHRIGYDCELEAGHEGNHQATDIDAARSKVGWAPGREGEYRRDMLNRTWDLGALTWQIEVKVHRDAVADGIDLSNAEAVWMKLCRAFPLAKMSHLSVRVVSAPSPEQLAEAKKG